MQSSIIRARKELPEYERKKRKFATKDDAKIKELLPLKIKSKIIRRKIPLEVNKSPLFKNSKKKENLPLIVKKPKKLDTQPIDIKTASIKDTLKYRQKVCYEYKIFFKENSSEIMSSPGERVKLFESMISKMKNAPLPSLKKFAISIITETLIDVIPGYRVRELSELELSVTVSRDVRKVRDLESKLLLYYKQTIDLLIEIYNENLKVIKKLVRQESSISIIGSNLSAQLITNCCAESICKLFTQLPYFNYFEKLSEFCVKQLFLHKKLLTLQDIFQRAIQTVFLEDKHAEVSLQVIRSINYEVKRRLSSLTPPIIDTLLWLVIPEEIVSKEIKNSATDTEFSHLPRNSLSKKQRKMQKLTRNLKKDLEDAQLMENDKKLKTNYSEILNILFAIYLRILRSPSPTIAILSSTVEGIGKFCHLLSVDFLGDILLWLSKIASTSQFSPPQALKVSVVVLRLLQEKGQCLQCVDHNLLIQSCYRNLSEAIICKASSNCDSLATTWQVSSSSSILLVECAQRLLINWKKELGQKRMYAFIKRFFAIALNLQNLEVSTKILEILKKTFDHNLYQVCNMVETGGEHGGLMSFRMDVKDPEYCNADSELMWEYSLLHRHYHHGIATITKRIGEVAEAKLTKLN